MGQSVFFPNCCSFRSLPPSPPMQCWTTGRQAFPYEQHCMGGGGESRIWPKERWFPCEKLIDGRGSAFCKLVPHNFGQDCSLNHHFQHSAHSVYKIYSVFKLFEIAVCSAHFDFFEITTPVMRIMLTMANIV